MKNKTRQKRYRKPSKRKTKVRLRSAMVPVQSCLPSVHKNPDKLSQSCFTKDIVATLVNVYNQSITQASEKINTNHPVETQLKELKENMNKHCLQEKNKEFCLVNALNQTDILRKSFMPVRKWKSPNEWLTNEDTDKVMAMYERAYPQYKYCETVTIDFAEICKVSGCISKYFCQNKISMEKLRPFKQWGMILNLDKHWESGSHWVSLFIDLENHFVYYFDSASTKVPNQIQHLFESLKRKYPGLEFKSNGKIHQQSNTECGVYAVFFQITMLTKQIPYISLKPMSTLEIQDLFSHGDIPDEFIQQYRHVFFS